MENPRQVAAARSLPVDEQALQKELRGATTLMLRHIPNSVKVPKLVEMLVSAGFGQQVDYVYLPCDKKTLNNKGYAFVNFSQPDDAANFARQMQGRAWSANSPKRLDLTRASAQGVAENLARLQSIWTGSLTNECSWPWVRIHGHLICVAAPHAARVLELHEGRDGQWPEGEDKAAAKGRGERKGRKGRWDGDEGNWERDFRREPVPQNVAGQVAGAYPLAMQGERGQWGGQSGGDAQWGGLASFPVDGARPWGTTAPNAQAAVWGRGTWAPPAGGDSKGGAWRDSAQDQGKGRRDGEFQAQVMGPNMVPWQGMQQLGGFPMAMGGQQIGYPQVQQINTPGVMGMQGMGMVQGMQVQGQPVQGQGQPVSGAQANQPPAQPPPDPYQLWGSPLSLRGDLPPSASAS